MEMQDDALYCTYVLVPIQLSYARPVSVYL
jgi:hypothetical protein